MTTSITPPPTNNGHTRFSFLDLPAEIRNEIYTLTYQHSRTRDPAYRIPDFFIHRRGIRWMNVEQFPLLLACKQIFLEARPVISADSHLAIKVELSKQQNSSRGADVCYMRLIRNADLCCHVRKVSLALTLGIYREGNGQLGRIAEVLKGYDKLEHLTFRFRASYIEEESLEALRDVVALTKKGVGLCFQLLVHGRWRRSERRDTEDAINEIVSRYGSRRSEIRVEWTRNTPLPLLQLLGEQELYH